MVCDEAVRELFAISRSRRLLAALVFTLSAAVFFSGCSRPEKEDPDVIVIHSGRLRGNVYPLSLQSIAPLQHYQYLAGYVQQVRNEAAKTGAKVLLVDLGDSLTGSFASHVTNSENMVTFFNDTGYDAIVLSNLDGDVKPALLAKLKAKVLNPFQNAEGQPATEGTEFGAKLDLGGIPVFLLANFYGDTPQNLFPDRFPATFGSAQSGVTPLRDYEKILSSLGQRPAGSLTLLTWMKFESPKNPPESFLQTLRKLNVSAILAHRIYGGDETDAWASTSFFGWNPPVSVNILRKNGGFSIARIDLKKDGDGWKVLGHQLLPMTANTAPADKAIADAVARFAPTISEADSPLALLPAIVSQENILRIYLDALAAVPETDAVLYSIQSIRTTWLGGELRASQVFNSLPWTTPIVQLQLTPDQIDSLAKDLKLTVLLKDEALGESLTVTTSQYFGQLIAAKLSLPPEALVPTAQKSEFDYFVGYLKTHPEATNGSPSAGWSLKPSPQQ